MCVFKRPLFLFFFVLFPILFSILFSGTSKASYFVEVARASGLHPLVLYGIAQVESTRSGRKGLGKPWPWTVNFNGRGEYFESKMDAMTAVDQALRGGMKSIDVGIMQVNLKYHGHRFKTLNEAFDPLRNIEVAADILNEFSGDPLVLQIARYHCPAKKCRKRALVYANKVIDRLN
jgi:hypothetical protein